MAHTLGGTTLPLPAALTESTGADWIETLVNGFRLTIERFCGAAWSQLAPGEPIVRIAVPRDPIRFRFSITQLPALFLWADRSVPVTTERLGQEIVVRNIELTLAWVPSTSQWAHSDKWSNFWVALDAALDMAVNSEFSPWTTATANGKLLVDAADLWKLSLGQGAPSEIRLEGASQPVESYEWRLIAQQRVAFDQAAQPAPVAPNRVENNYEQSEDFALTSRLRQADWQS